MARATRRGQPDAVLLVSHGSRDPRAQHTTVQVESALASRLAERLDTVVEVRTGFLDFASPQPEQVLRDLADTGYRSIRIVPLLFTPGYHLTHDLPNAVKASGATGVSCAPCLLGVPGDGRQLLLQALSDRLDAAAESLGRGGGARPDAVVLAAAGSSSRAARSSVEYLARELGRLRGIPAVSAFASAAPPTTAEALDLLRGQGSRRPAVAALFVAPGRLPDAVRAGADEVIVADPLGMTPAFIEVLALQGDHGVWQDAPHEFLRSPR